MCWCLQKHTKTTFTTFHFKALECDVHGLFLSIFCEAVPENFNTQITVLEFITLCRDKQTHNKETDYTQCHFTMPVVIWYQPLLKYIISLFNL